MGKIGWASQGYTAKDALHIRSERLHSIRHGEELPSHKKGEVTGNRKTYAGFNAADI
jgi:hypothetical protein